MSSLLAERGPIHVHVGATTIMEGPPPRFERLLGHVDTRLNLVPRFRQKVTSIPMRVSNPVWADDSRFDLRWHVRRVALPRPGTREQLAELVGQVMSVPLDFQRPLWQVYVIEGLAGGRRHSYISKTHHALVDGVSAVDVGTLLLDPNPRGTKMTLPEEDWEPDEPSPEMLFVRAASDRLGTPLRAVRRTARTLAMPKQTATAVMKTAEGFAGLAAGGPRCDSMPFNVDIGPDRRVAFVRARLANLKRARGKEGATVNDVVLSVVAGALRRFLRARRVKLPEHIVALVPVSVRRPDEHLELGNRISTILVRLPIRERNARRRLERIRAETARLKESEQARAASLIINATGWAPPTINRLLSSAISRPLTWNLVVSNVPGPQVPFYLLGRRMLEAYPFVPLSPQGHGLSIGVVSYDGGVFFGLVGDRDEMDDLDQLAAALDESIEEQAVATP
jgi:diacylglycerol O-acyltransferase / wax synthase